MTLEAKKYSLIQWIIAVADERAVIEIEKVKSQTRLGVANPLQSELKGTYTPSSFSEIQSRKVDVDQLKQTQNYQALSTHELDQIVKDADLKESIDQLLADLKEIG